MSLRRRRYDDLSTSGLNDKADPYWQLRDALSEQLYKIGELVNLDRPDAAREALSAAMAISSELGSDREHGH